MDKKLDKIIRELTESNKSAKVKAAENIKSIETKMTQSLEGKFTSVEWKISSMDGKIASMEGKIASVEGNIESMKDNMKNINAKLDIILNFISK